MKLLPAKFPRSHYKTETGYLRSVYAANKDKINTTFGDLTFTTPLKAFMSRVREMQYDKYLTSKAGKKKVTVSQAVEGLARTEDFMSRADRLKTNAMKALRSDKEAFARFRKATGWKQKVDYSKLRWSPDEQAYIYEGKSSTVMIDFTNSPKAVRVYELQED